MIPIALGGTVERAKRARPWCDVQLHGRSAAGGLSPEYGARGADTSFSLGSLLLVQGKPAEAEGAGDEKKGKAKAQKGDGKADAEKGSAETKGADDEKKDKGKAKAQKGGAKVKAEKGSAETEGKAGGAAAAEKPSADKDSEGDGD